MYDYGMKLQAARARHSEGKTWQECAAEIGAVDSTVRLWDSAKDKEWVKACAEIIDEMRREGNGVAWRCLVNAAKGGDVSAAKELLNRTEGAVPQKQELTGAGGGPVQIVNPEQLALMAARETEPDGNGESD